MWSVVASVVLLFVFVEPLCKSATIPWREKEGQKRHFCDSETLLRSFICSLFSEIYFENICISTIQLNRFNTMRFPLVESISGVCPDVCTLYLCLNYVDLIIKPLECTEKGNYTKPMYDQISFECGTKPNRNEAKKCEVENSGIIWIYMIVSNEDLRFTSHSNVLHSTFRSTHKTILFDSFRTTFVTINVNMSFYFNLLLYDDLVLWSIRKTVHSKCIEWMTPNNDNITHALNARIVFAPHRQTDTHTHWKHTEEVRQLAKERERNRIETHPNW